MDALDERAKVARYLETKDVAFGAEVAWECLGKRYSELNARDWQRIAGHVLAAAGWQSRKVHGHAVWVKPEPAPAQGSLAL
jgi:hypothetical protein